MKKLCKHNKSFGAVLAIVMILAETFRADRATLQNHANAHEDARRQAAQNVVISNQEMGLLKYKNIVYINACKC